MAKRRILATSGLPYSNGPIHLGHLVESIQTDIWVRFQKQRGHECRYFCADDTHGTATMIRAQQVGREPEDLISEMNADHQRDFAGFRIEFDHYGSTHSESNRRLVGEVWAALREGGHVAERDVTQLYDPEAGIFLADRFVKGTCPRCSAAEQYGDSCDRCSATYSPSDLTDPRSTLTGAVPEERTAPHLFVKLTGFQDFLEDWTQTGDRLPPEIAHWLAGTFLSEPLRDWDVSRPAPYFGFEIPDAPGHYFYVWVDAPVGYMASCADWCDQVGDSLDRWWRDPECEIHHFIGKDITYFHTLFWPAMMKAAGIELPRKVHVHGFLTVNGEKMSKSRGTFVRASTYLEHLSPDYLRYYYASKLSRRVDDIDLNFEDFAQKVNSDLVGKVVNLASRTARFIKGEPLADPYPDDGGLFQRAATAGDEIAEAFEALDTNRAMRLVMALADRANEFVEAQAPWKLKKDPDKKDELRAVCSIALNLFRQITVYLAPVLPTLAQQAAALLSASDEVRWEDASVPRTGGEVKKFRHLMERVDAEQVEAVIESSREEAPAPSGEGSAGEAFAGEPLLPECTIDDFVKIDLRVARIVSAKLVPKANKLLDLELDLGGGERRRVFAGIKQAYDPNALEGRLTVMVANLAPRKMRFGTSEGMVLAAGAGGDELYLLAPDSGAVPGQRIR